MKKTLALAALALVLLLGAASQSSNSVPGQLKEIQSQLNDLRPRQFYLTQTPYNGAEALTACAVGYHMASLWEIHDPTNLRYNRALGAITEDSGFGPPSLQFGWIRTGTHPSSNISSIPGRANCSAWTSDSLAQDGTKAELPDTWNSPAGLLVAPWIVSTAACGSGVPVWCVQD